MHENDKTISCKKKMWYKKLEQVNHVKIEQWITDIVACIGENLQESGFVISSVKESLLLMKC